MQFDYGWCTSGRGRAGWPWCRASSTVPGRYDDSADSVFRIFWFAAFSDKIRKTAPTRPTQEETLFLHVWNAGLSWISGYIKSLFYFFQSVFDLPVHTVAPELHLK